MSATQNPLRIGTKNSQTCQLLAGPRESAERHGTKTDPAALKELLQTYPGLLEGEVGAVARALAQATMAASAVAMHSSNSEHMSALEKIRLGRKLDKARAVSREDEREKANSAEGEEGGRQQTGGQRRRWITQAHLRRLQSEGVVFRKGKFTEEENTIIDEAVTAFVEMQGLTRQQMYEHLFQQRRGHGGDAGRQVRRAFWPVLAEALPERPLQAIYHHVRRKFHPHNYQGAWTAGEDERLQQLVAVHGPAWEAISQQMGRMGTNCRDRWRYIQGGRGPRAVGSRASTDM
ncbi:RNA polymerase I enhancer binding protein [Coemansia sp. RSA 1290]|nr:RNA polymerase I enhancer binding protein [Coemansia sp. RSA 1086]KAJ1869009.1 RNA polymerase I enhancer binding protein [Coemansia sp. RSA 990]KAJ2629608.1 RNA polymerase I enhancer binding protein [Coemansia sp. RSA 1290]KAJ2672021.1 RNA polymerase I enhancer binding protein [Coemansia sp. RSA 1085]